MQFVKWPVANADVANEHRSLDKKLRFSQFCKLLGPAYDEFGNYLVFLSVLSGSLSGNGYITMDTSLWLLPTYFCWM